MMHNVPQIYATELHFSGYSIVKIMGLLSVLQKLRKIELLESFPLYNIICLSPHDYYE